MTELETLQTKLSNIVASLDRGMAVIAPLEDAYRAITGEIPNVEDLPDGELKTNLIKWAELLSRYEETQKQIRLLIPKVKTDDNDSGTFYPTKPGMGRVQPRIASGKR